MSLSKSLPHSILHHTHHTHHTIWWTLVPLPISHEPRPWIQMRLSQLSCSSLCAGFRKSMTSLTPKPLNRYLYTAQWQEATDMYTERYKRGRKAPVFFLQEKMSWRTFFLILLAKLKSAKCHLNNPLQCLSRVWLFAVQKASRNLKRKQTLRKPLFLSPSQALELSAFLWPFFACFTPLYHIFPRLFQHDFQIIRHLK